MRNKALNLPPVIVRTENQEYIDSETKELLFSVPMRRFYMWVSSAGEYQMQREYPLANESQVNPNYKHTGDT